MLPLWELVHAASAQRIPSAVLREARMPCGQQGGKSAEVVPEEPPVLPRGTPCKPGPGVAAGTSRVLEAPGGAGGPSGGGCVTRCLVVATH